MLLISELLFFFTHPSTLWNQQVRRFISQGFSTLKGHSWILQYLLILNLTTDLNPGPVCRKHTGSCMYHTVQWALDQALLQSPAQPCFFQKRQTCGVIQIQMSGNSWHPGCFLHGFQMSLSHQYRVTSPPDMCWALFKRTL